MPSKYYIRINLKNVNPLCTEIYEKLEDRLKELLESMGIDAEIFDSITTNELTVQGDETKNVVLCVTKV